MMTPMTHSTRRLAVSCLMALAATVPLWADADGLPHLDPTDGNGTTYTFVMPQISRSMDPGEDSFQSVYRGELTIIQLAGEASFDAVMEIDVTGDGQNDRTLSCSGWNGRNRFGMTCSKDDLGADVNLLITGRAVRFADGTLSLRKATGHGFTETHTLLVTFAAIAR